MRISNSRRRLQSETTEQVLRPLDESQRVLAAMVQMATRIGKPFSEARMQQLHDDLHAYPVDGIEWAIDSWSRNSKVLPALSDLLQLLRTWHVENVQETCEPECQMRHGKGYGKNDVIWLWKERQKSAKGWSTADYEAALSRLDSTRAGGAPEWRQ
jgi:hypothetical protein